MCLPVDLRTLGTPTLGHLETHLYSRCGLAVVTYNPAGRSSLEAAKRRLMRSHAYEWADESGVMPAGSSSIWTTFMGRPLPKSTRSSLKEHSATRTHPHETFAPCDHIHKLSRTRSTR